MGLGERTLSRCFGAAIVTIDLLARGASEFPDAGIGRPFRVAELNRAHVPVDQHASIAKFQRKPR
jgi:hypothetical protein